MSGDLANNQLSVHMSFVRLAFSLCVAATNSGSQERLTMRSTIAHFVRWTRKSYAFARPLA